MAHDDRPLLARATSADSSIRGIEEEDALLTGQPMTRSRDSKVKKYRETGITIYAILATIAIIVLGIVVNHESARGNSKKSNKGWDADGKPTGKRNLIFMVSDGMGPTSLSLTRSFRQYTEGLPIDDLLVLDRHHIGTSRTRSSSSLVTDSAAGATAFSCGFKSYNGAISVLPDHSPCGTILEAAKKAGYMTGLVVTTRLTDATPACFAAHANRREYEDLIAEQLIGNYPLGRTVDLLIGGGRCYFLSNSTSGSCRSDNTDVVELAKNNGFNYIDNRKDFDNLNIEGGVKLPLLALLADHDIPYEIDRVHVADTYPSQSEMTELALKALSVATKDSDKGFFLMVEGSRIDHAGHGNDPAAQVHEVMAHDKAFTAILDFLKDEATPGVLVSTSDHETGGVAAARQLGQAYPRYLWYPGVLANASHSASYLASEWGQYVTYGDGQSASRKDKSEFLTSILASDFGILDASTEEIDAIIDAIPIWPPSYLFADMISRRAQVGWSTHGHSAVDVNIYASSPEHARALVGNHENTDVGKFLQDFLEVNVEEITKELVSKGVRQENVAVSEESQLVYDWMGPVGLPTNFNGKFDELDPYHGDYKHRKREADAQDAACGCGMKH